jgi:membrane protein
MADEEGAGEPADQSRLAALRESLESRQTRLLTWLEGYRQRRPLIDLAGRIVERDRAAAGSVVGSALALRLFLFFVPLLLFSVGLIGVFAGLLSAEHVDDSGLKGVIAEQIKSALDQQSSTHWLAFLTGLIGMATAGRVLSRTIAQASCLAWQMPVRARTSVRLMGCLIGVIVGGALISAVVDRIREAAGLGVAGISFVAVMGVYAAAWLLISSLLPRPTSDPGVLLPGAVLVGLTVALLQAVSTLFVPGRVTRASELYGAIGVTIVTLGWFFILGRVMVLSLVINAAVFERFGSISHWVFGLPVIRRLPRRWPAIGRHFEL